MTVLIYALSVSVSLILGGALTWSASRTVTISLQERQIRARDGTISDLQTELATVKREHQEQLDELQTMIFDLRGCVDRLLGDNVDKDETIAIFARESKTLKAKLLHYDEARASCPHPNCPIDRRKRVRLVKPPAKQGGQP
jgi:TolA-binding protein